jgi:hypothetical protein
MNKLRDQYKRFIYTVFGLTASVYFFFLLKIPSSKSILDNLDWFGLSWAVFAGLIVVVYERWGWRIFNPKFDLVGLWNFTESQYVAVGDRQRAFDYDARGSVRILQDLQSIRLIEGQTYKTKPASTIVPSERNKTADWWSIACELNDTASRMDAVLDHAPTLAEGNGIQYGVEIFRITARTKWGRPTKMSSTVYHCVGSGKAHQIDVSYTRDGF